MFESYKNFRNTPSPEDTSNSKILFRDCLVEFVATIVFVFSGTLSIIATGALLVGTGFTEDAAKLFPIAFSFGISITVLVYSIGHLTGGHMNPAVSLMMWILRQISLKKMCLYWFSQFLGAMIASCLLWACFTEPVADFEEGSSVLLNLGATTLNPALNHGNGFLLELMGSFFFYFVIAQTALDKKGIANSMLPPLAIGLSLVVAHIGLIPFTGCGINPARTFGPAVVVCMDSHPNSDCAAVIGSWWWIYWIAPFCSSFLVAEFHSWLQVTEETEESGEGQDEADAKESVPLMEAPTKSKEENETADVLPTDQPVDVEQQSTEEDIEVVEQQS